MPRAERLGPRSRLISVAKELFARHGYEQTPISTIARQAATSESQLVRSFGSKAGLLEAIFDAGWKPLNEHVQRVMADAADSREAIFGVLSAVSAAFRHDRDLAFLMLVEGRRLRGDRHELRFSAGFREFSELLRRLILRGQRDGTFARDLDEAGVASALLGAAESMLREEVLADQASRPAPFSEQAIHRIFAAIVEGLSSAAAPAVAAPSGRAPASEPARPVSVSPTRVRRGSRS